MDISWNAGGYTMIPNPFSGIDLSWLNPQRIAKLIVGILLLGVGIFAVVFNFTDKAVANVTRIAGKL